MKTLPKLQALLALLQTQYFYYLTCHWTSKGREFYQDHLLFERLYGALPGQVDALAEKMVCFYDDAAVDFCKVSKSVYERAEELDGKDHFEGALLLENALQLLIKDTYSTMQGEGSLSPGMDDYLLALANDHETHIYLLSRVSGKTSPPKGMKK